MRRFLIQALALLLLAATPVRAEDPLILEPSVYSVQYMLTYSGTVGLESVTNGRGLLTISHVDVYDTNPYEVFVLGYPYLNSRNSFYWDSRNTPMTALSTEIKCVIPSTAFKQSDNHFFYMSPSLLMPENFTHDQKEDIKASEGMALPTQIMAQAGELTLRISGNTVSGFVWMNGYDFIESSYVRYAVTISGYKTYNTKTRTQDHR